jgi:hypothetical protein
MDDGSGISLARRAVAIAARLKTTRLQRLALMAEEDDLAAELQDVHALLAAHHSFPSSSMELEATKARASLSANVLNVVPRDFQLEAVASVLMHRHTFLVWPAGGGKGLTTHMLAACAPEAVTIIEVPLIGLAHELYVPSPLAQLP